MAEQTLTWLVVQHETTRRTVSVFVLGPTPAAVLWSHRARRWVADPATVAEVSLTNRVEGQDRLTVTDRAGAEEAARAFGQTLPPDEELRRLLSAEPTLPSATGPRLTGPSPSSQRTRSGTQRRHVDGRKETPMVLDTTTYWEVRRGTPPQLKTVYVVPPPPGPALLWNRRTRTWDAAPGVVDRALTRDWAAGAGQMTSVDRTTASRLAHELGTTLPEG